MLEAQIVAADDPGGPPWFETGPQPTKEAALQRIREHIEASPAPADSIVADDHGQYRIVDSEGCTVAAVILSAAS